MRNMQFVADGNRVIGRTTEEAFDCEAAPTFPEDEGYQVELNLLPVPVEHGYTMTEAADIIYQVLDMACGELGVSLREMLKRVNERDRETCRASRRRARMVQEDAAVWADR